MPRGATAILVLAISSTIGWVVAMHYRRPMSIVLHTVHKDG